MEENKMIDPREDKLPRWAQQQLAAERRRADTAEHRLAEHLATVEPTPIWYGDYQNPIYIPNRYGFQRVHFDLGEPGEHYTEMQVSITRDGRLDVQAGHAVSIDLQSANTFQARFAR